MMTGGEQMDEHLLEVKNLKVSFKIGKKKLTAVDNVTFSLDRGKVIGIVGESGCGKSVTATSIMRLVSPSVCEIDENSQILFEGEDLSKASEARMRDRNMCRIWPEIRFADGFIENFVLWK
jgi:ABC-type dipeptide/oligopeptide/nickel transport system ATPase component